jgi:hypothetical protein
VFSSGVFEAVFSSGVFKAVFSSGVFEAVFSSGVGCCRSPLSFDQDGTVEHLGSGKISFERESTADCARST